MKTNGDYWPEVTNSPGYKNLSHSLSMREYDQLIEGRYKVFEEEMDVYFNNPLEKP
jgi:hypothetical protein